MKVLITGIGGFVGSHLADYLVAKEIQLFGLMRDVERNENIKNIINHISLHQADINDFTSLLKVIKQTKPDIILHTAGQPFVPSSFEHTAETFQVNVIGTINLLEAIKAADIKTRTLIITSGEIYGEVIGLPLPTEKSIPNPVNPYAASKTSIDYISQTYKKFEGLDIVIARPFNHTGPRQRANFVCSSIAKQLVNLKKTNQKYILNLGNISAQRDFTDVRDVVKAYWQIANLKENENFIFNVSSGIQRTIKNVIQLFEKIIGEEISINVEKRRLRGYDIQLMAGDSTLIKNITGWKPIIPFEQTLQDLLHYWEQKEIE